MKFNIKFERLFYVLLAAFLIAVALVPLWGTDAAGAKKGLQALGFTQERLGTAYLDYGWLNCMDSVYVTRFAARDARGQAVEGYYCSSPFTTAAHVEIIQAVKP
jgi:hypothetical protein